MLIQHGADVDKTKTKNRTTPLNIACTNGRKAVAELLISSGADVDETDSDGKPALAAAVDNGHSEIVAMLLEHENVNADELADEFLTALLLVAAGMEALEEMFDNMVWTSWHFLFHFALLFEHQSPVITHRVSIIN